MERQLIYLLNWDLKVSNEEMVEVLGSFWNQLEHKLSSWKRSNCGNNNKHNNNNFMHLLPLLLHPLFPQPLPQLLHILLHRHPDQAQSAHQIHPLVPTHYTINYTTGKILKVQFHPSAHLNQQIHFTQQDQTHHQALQHVQYRHYHQQLLHPLLLTRNHNKLINTWLIHLLNLLQWRKRLNWITCWRNSTNQRSKWQLMMLLLWVLWVYFG